MMDDPSMVPVPADHPHQPDGTTQARTFGSYPESIGREAVGPVRFA